MTQVGEFDGGVGVAGTAWRCERPHGEMVHFCISQFGQPAVSNSVRSRRAFPGSACLEDREEERRKKGSSFCDERKAKTGTYHSPLPDPRTESPRPEALESRSLPAAIEAKLAEGSWTGMVM
jgi:hypothetical protein